MRNEKGIRMSAMEEESDKRSKEQGGHVGAMHLKN